jgi:hypothetical protein
MSDRRWLPTEYQDEGIPPPRPTPNDWIERLDDGAFCLGSESQFEDSERGRLLKDGEVVEFDWTEHLGSGEIIMTPDGGFELNVEEPEAPEGALLLCWIPVDAETISNSAADLAKNLEVGDQLRIDWYCWSSKATPFVFHSGKFTEKAVDA